MIIKELAESTCVRVSAQSGRLEACVERVYAGDRISDMLEQASDTTLVVTNLMGASLLRVAQLMDIPAVCLVNGKEPDPAMKEAAERQGTALLVSPFDMFETCGRLYAALRSRACPEGVRGTGG